MDRKQNEQKIMQYMAALFGTDEAPNPVQMKGLTDLVGGYAVSDVMIAARHFDNNRHQYKAASKRWPYAGEIMDLIKSWRAKPLDFGVHKIENRNGKESARSQAYNWHDSWLTCQGACVRLRFHWLIEDWKKQNKGKVEIYKQEYEDCHYKDVLFMMWKEGIPQKFEKDERAKYAK